MMSQFFCGQVMLLLKRCHTLIEHLKDLNNLPEELKLHINNVSTELEKLAYDIQEIINDPDFGVEILLKNQINSYRRYAEYVNILETSKLTLLYHFNKKDYYFYKFGKLFCEQVNYSCEEYPLISTHSSDYFSALPVENIINIPLCEDNFLLAIPDFVHELGHLLYNYYETEITQPFSTILCKYIKEQRDILKNKNPSKAYPNYFKLLEQTWLQEYIVEFSCDICATYLVGSAYGWSHLRLLLESDPEIYYPSFGQEGSHPADEARMRAILLTLQELGESEKVENIIQKWEEFKLILVDSPDGEYEYCYPNEILRQLAKQVIKVCEEVGLIPYYKQPDSNDNLPSLMQKAWKQFHNDPTKYGEWENNTVKHLKSFLLREASF
ncbi:hypothetical protein WJM97_23165 (plasmid) [Okeanomitos corallinicola TIOX110]|uniref:Uncharacterized protein n=1 Tax=Okeanomitos corallinicola TIOX110 TaxID=3133117 RepID=A0ABZ2V003_9CYAN